jgi:hypothetical protein
MRFACVFALLALAGCSSQPARWSGFVEVGTGILLSTPADAGPRDIRDVQNPRGVLAGGVCVDLGRRLELTGAIRHESGQSSTTTARPVST